MFKKFASISSLGVSAILNQDWLILKIRSLFFFFYFHFRHILKGKVFVCFRIPRGLNLDYAPAVHPERPSFSPDSGAMCVQLGRVRIPPDALPAPLPFIYTYIFLKETGNVQFVFFTGSPFLFVYAGFNPFAATHNRICSMTSCPFLFLSIHLPVGRIDLMEETFLYKLLNLDYRSAGTGGRAPTRQVKERGGRDSRQKASRHSLDPARERQFDSFFSVFLQLFFI